MVKRGFEDSRGQGFKGMPDKSRNGETAKRRNGANRYRLHNRGKTVFFMKIALFVVLFSAFSSQLSALSAENSPFDSLKKSYSQINTLEARFHQIIFISSLKKEREFDGEFYYKRQRGFLWRYKTPKVKYFLYDGRFIWQGEEEKSFIIKDRVNKEKTSGTFLDLIEDIAKLDDIFTLKEHSRAGNLEILELLPKKDTTVKSARVWIDNQNLVKKIQIHEFTGNVNTIEFFSIKPNRSIDDSRFTFKPEAGKEIIER
ncbi:MAG: outer membrane lipoprotein carrier protein LolA [Proteobacteria bacterium]|nr:outer membrane lipoprotein carrier protein LolA [Pseudomonadota bacterium]